MSSPPPLVNFYDLSGPQPWSPACWCTRYALNYKRIPYTVIPLSFPAIKPTCETLFPSMTGLEATVPIIEILGPNYKVLNDSTPIAELLNERFLEKDGYRTLRGVEEVRAYEEKLGALGRGLVRWIISDVWANALDENDGSREYFRERGEKVTGCRLEDVLEIRGGGEEAVLRDIGERWGPLRERMRGDDGRGEPTYVDFFDAAHVKWVEGASSEKYEKLMRLYGDDTFTKLMKKVEKYSV